MMFQIIPPSDGSAQSPFAGPVGIRCRDDGRLFVVDDLGHRVLVFDANAKHLMTLGRHGAGPGELLWPDAITLGRGWIALRGRRRGE